MDEELGCRWDSSELGLDWQADQPMLSPRDDAAGSYAEMVDAFVAKTAA